MYNNNEESNFNLFAPCQTKIKENQAFDLENKGLPQSNSYIQKLSQFQYEMSKYERKISEGNYNYKGNANYHFEFNGPLNFSSEENKINDKKTINDEDINNINLNNLSLIQRKIDSDSQYIGFENKYGENSCYINVVLHLLYHFPCINEYLIKLYKNKIDTFNLSNSNITDFNNIDFFLFLLGKTFFEYQKILSNLDNKGITILQTTELRKYLDLISNNNYQLNKVADPVELLTFLLNIINKNNQIEVHKYFFINLIEEIQCGGFCQKKTIKKYDKDNFIYYIYVNEIMNHINQKYLHFRDYNHKLFKFSRIISLNYFKICQKCGKTIIRKLKCNGPDYPTFLLINCVWNNKKQELKDVLKFLYLLSLEDDLNNLFFCTHNNSSKIIYNLLGMILYSSALSHYINVMFNIQKNIFVLYDDDKIKELKSIHEVYREITVEQIKKNPKAFFYPVLLIYYKEIIYDDETTIKINDYSIQKYNNLVEECKKAKKKKEIILTEEQKRQNYMEYVKAQMKYDNENYDNYFNNNKKISSTNLYKVKEEEQMDEEKDNKSLSNKSFKMIIEEDSKDKNINNNNNINNNIINEEFLKNNNNNRTSSFNSQMFQDTNINRNYTTNLGKKINIPFDNLIFDQSDYFGIRSYQSGNNILQFNSNKNCKDLLFDSDQENNIDIKRKNRKHGTDSKSYRNHNLKNIDFFSNIM